MIIFFDIETIADYPVHEEVLKEVKDKYGEGLNFMPEHNRVLTITVGVKTVEGTKIENLPGSEEEQIKKFFDIISKEYKTKDAKKWFLPRICGHNIKGFDLPFVIKRALHYKIKIPNTLKAYGKKPRDMDHLIDTFEAYKYLSFSGKGSLDLICSFLDIPTPKQNMSGAEVQKYYDDGKIEEILEYCKLDVEATINVYDKFVDLNLI